MRYVSTALYVLQLYQIYPAADRYSHERAPVHMRPRTWTSLVPVVRGSIVLVKGSNACGPGVASQSQGQSDQLPQPLPLHTTAEATVLGLCCEQ